MKANALELNEVEVEQWLNIATIFQNDINIKMRKIFPKKPVTSHNNLFVVSIRMKIN